MTNPVFPSLINLPSLHGGSAVHMKVVTIVTSTNGQAEVITGGDSDLHGPMLQKRTVSASLLEKFTADWKAFFLQSQELKSVYPGDPAIDGEISAGLLKKGRALSSMLFGADSPPAMRSKSKIIIFSVDPEYAGLPYEVLACGDAFLCDTAHVMRQVRDATPPKPSSGKEAARLLLVCGAGNADGISELVDREREMLGGLFDGTRRLSRWKAVDAGFVGAAGIMEELHDAGYVHFAGHTESDRIILGNGGVIHAKDIAGLDLSSMELVFLNGCYSSVQDPCGDSLARSFLRAGAKNYLGYGLPVHNSAALFISVKFWESFFKKKNALDAVRHAREAVRSEFGEGELAWATLNLFGTVRERGPKPLLTAGRAAAIAGSVFMAGAAAFLSYNMPERAKLFSGRYMEIQGRNDTPAKNAQGQDTALRLKGAASPAGKTGAESGSFGREGRDREEKNNEPEIPELKHPNGRDRSGNTPLMAAAMSGNTSLVEALLERGADANLKNDHGVTALMMSSGSGNVRISSLLLDNGADPDIKGRGEMTALMFAADYGQVSAVNLLIDRGAKTGTRDARGRTALMHASGNGHLTIVRLLLRGGAETGPIDSLGQTALMYAAAQGNAAIVKLLLDTGAKTGIKDRQGMTALDHALKKSRAEAAELLKKAGGK